VGGTGSHVASQLAHLGIGHLGLSLGEESAARVRIANTGNSLPERSGANPVPGGHRAGGWRSLLTVAVVVPNGYTHARSRPAPESDDCPTGSCGLVDP
jgi:hypothetical protein